MGMTQVGTLVATIILRSFLLTGICGLLQADGHWSQTLID